jgi:hypothetical protein
MFFWLLNPEEIDVLFPQNPTHTMFFSVSIPDHVISRMDAKKENHRKGFFDLGQTDRQTTAFIFFRNTLPRVERIRKNYFIL